MKIWTDTWIPIPSMRMIQSPVALLDVEAHVLELIYDNLTWWKENIIQAIFTKQEIEAIKSIPINRRTKEAQLVWNYTRTDKFIVKSTY